VDFENATNRQYNTNHPYRQKTFHRILTFAGDRLEEICED
jgi:hypothetical protein